MCIVKLRAGWLPSSNVLRLTTAFVRFFFFETRRHKKVCKTKMYFATLFCQGPELPLLTGYDLVVL